MCHRYWEAWVQAKTGESSGPREVPQLVQNHLARGQPNPTSLFPVQSFLYYQTVSLSVCLSIVDLTAFLLLFPESNITSKGV